MSHAIKPYDPELEAERLLLEAAVAKARADRRYAPHEEVRAWLLELANGKPLKATLDAATSRPGSPKANSPSFP